MENFNLVPPAGVDIPRAPLPNIPRIPSPLALPAALPPMPQAIPAALPPALPALPPIPPAIPPALPAAIPAAIPLLGRGQRGRAVNIGGRGRGRVVGRGERRQDGNQYMLGSRRTFMDKIIRQGPAQRYFPNQIYNFNQTAHPYSFEYPTLDDFDTDMDDTEVQDMRRAILQYLEEEAIARRLVGPNANYDPDSTNLRALPDPEVESELDYIPDMFYPFLVSPEAKRVPYRYRMWDPYEPSVPSQQRDGKLLQEYAPTFEFSGAPLAQRWLRKISDLPREYINLQPMDVQRVAQMPWIWNDLLYKPEQFRNRNDLRSAFGEELPQPDQKEENEAAHRGARFNLWARMISASKPSLPVLMNAMNNLRDIGGGGGGPPFPFPPEPASPLPAVIPPALPAVIPPA